MLKLTWKTWLAVWVAIAVAANGLYFLLAAQEADAPARWLAFAGGFIGSAWTLYGLYRWRETPWVKRVNTFVLTTVGFGLVTLLMLAIGWEPGWRTSIYLYLAVIGFLLGINLLRLILRPGYAALGVARTMLEEALRMGIALIFIVALLVLLVVMPLILSSEDRVTYMIQRFLTYSTAIVSVLLGLMTVLLAARSVSLELSSRQAHMTLTKPLARWQYLLGKWLGVVLLNAVLVTVAGVAIYGFTMSIARNPALNEFDRGAVHREVLTARLAMVPEPMDIGWDAMFDNMLQEKQQRDPEKFGEVGDPIGALPEPARQEIVAEAVARFYTIDGGSSKQYRFEGLENAVAASNAAIERARAILVDEGGLGGEDADQVTAWIAGRPNELTRAVLEQVPPQVIEKAGEQIDRETIQLVLTTDTSPEPDDQFVEFYLKVNNLPYPPPSRPGAPASPVSNGEVPVETPHEVNIPASMIGQDGTMLVTIEVPAYRRDGVRQDYLDFNYKDAQIELYYRVGSFEANLARAMAIVWLKLCFLAMLGLAAGSLMSFPVAAMVSLVVFVAATFSGVIDESLNSYVSAPDTDAWTLITSTLGTFFSHLGNGEVYEAFRVLVRVLGGTFMLLVPSFGGFNTTEPLSNGQVIGNGLLFKAFWKIGLMWTGIVGAIGLFFFSRKEIARVTV